MKMAVCSILILVLTLSSACVPGDVQISGGSLREIIENLQRSMVRESWAEDAASCFTWQDLGGLQRSRTFVELDARLRASSVFLAAVAKVRQMARDERLIYLKNCRRPLRPTWAQIHEMSRRGTTEAGQIGEALLANHVVDLAEQLLESNINEKGDVHEF